MTDLDDSVRKLFKGGGILLVGLVLQLGISFLGKLIIARELSIADFGSVALGTTVAMTLATTAQLGLHEGVGRYLPRFESDADRRGVLVSAISLAIPLALAFGSGLFITAPLVAQVVFNTPEVIPVFRVFAFVVPLMVTHQLVISTIQGQQRTAPKVIIENITKPISRITAIVVVVILGASAVRISLAYLAGWIIPVALGLGYLYRNTTLSDRSVDAVLRHRELLSFSLPLVISGMLTVVFNDLDTLLLGYFSGGTEQVALYNVVYSLGMLLQTGMVAFGFIFMPVLSELHSNEDYAGVNRMYQVVTKWVVVATLPVFLVMLTFPSQLISLTFGAKYSNGGIILQVLVLGFFIHSVAGLNRETASSIGRSRLLLYVDAVAAGINILLNIFLIPRFGPLGAATATTLSYLCLNLVLSGTLYRELDLVPITMAVVRPGLAGATAFVLVYAVAGYLTDPTPISLVISFGVFVLLYVVAVFRFGGIEAEEVLLVKSIEERFGINLEPIKRFGRRLIP